VPIRLMVGLSYLQHIFALSDEAVVERWVENPYWRLLPEFQGFHLPCSILSSMRLLSTSDTFSATTSEMRSPAP
jgi:IS5 family transposase